MPYKLLVISMILSGYSVESICEKLMSHRYYCKISEIMDLRSDILLEMPEIVSEVIVMGDKLDITNSLHIQWLNHYGIYDMFEYMTVRSTKEARSNHHLELCRKILLNPVVASVVNAFCFNGEPNESISTIVNWKYHTSLTDKCIESYKKYYWDCTRTDAFQAIMYYPDMKVSSVVTCSVNGEGVVSHAKELPPEFLGMESYPAKNMIFQDSDYIKWKIGYIKDLKVKSVATFLEEVQIDSMFKYRESRDLDVVVEVEVTDTNEDSSGGGGEFGDEPTSSRKKSVKRKFKDPTAHRASLQKAHLDMFIKATNAIPVVSESDSDFFQKLDEFVIDYGGSHFEQIIDINMNPEILDDIMSDIESSVKKNSDGDADVFRE